MLYESAKNDSIPGPRWKDLYTIGGVAALLQLSAILTMTVVRVVLGPKPAGAEEYFVIQQGSRLAAMLRFPLKIFAGQEPASDLRDWTAIRLWAESLLPRLGSFSVHNP